jgi:hypothetical protein
MVWCDLQSLKRTLTVTERGKNLARETNRSDGGRRSGFRRLVQRERTLDVVKPLQNLAQPFISAGNGILTMFLNYWHRY